MKLASVDHLIHCTDLGIARAARVFEIVRAKNDIRLIVRNYGNLACIHVEAMMLRWRTPGHGDPVLDLPKVVKALEDFTQILHAEDPDGEKGYWGGGGLTDIPPCGPAAILAGRMDLAEKLVYPPTAFERILLPKSNDETNVFAFDNLILAYLCDHNVDMLWDRHYPEFLTDEVEELAAETFTAYRALIQAAEAGDKPKVVQCSNECARLYAKRAKDELFKSLGMDMYGGGEYNKVLPDIRLGAIMHKFKIIPPSDSPAFIHQWPGDRVGGE